ncbi:MAG: YeeE/YedE family protein [Arenimonas sp.]|nr:YeeE/YedE family protein [Arenimonas sp.]
MSWRKPTLFAGLSGALFGLGLAVSGMTQPDRVLAFLDPLGRWDPSLGLVMAGALAVSLPGFAWVRRRGAAVCGPLSPPAKAGLDWRLLLGASLFGAGWGIAGYCPGPALAGLGQLSMESLWAVPAMYAGFWLAEKRQPRVS